MSEYESRGRGHDASYAPRATAQAEPQYPPRSPEELAGDRISRFGRDVAAVGTAVEALRRADAANDPARWQEAKQALDHQLATASKSLESARSNASEIAPAARQELATAEAALTDHKTAVGTMAEAPRGWKAVSREAELLAIVSAKSADGAKTGWEKKEAALKAEIDQLSAAECSSLAVRLRKQYPTDPIASALAPGVRMNQDRHDDLLNYLAGARKRDALRASQPEAPSFEAKPAEPQHAEPSTVSNKGRSERPPAATSEPETIDTKLRRVLESGADDVEGQLAGLFATLDDSTRRSLARRLETYRPGSGDDVGARFVRLERAARVKLLGVLHTGPSIAASLGQPTISAGPVAADPAWLRDPSEGSILRSPADTQGAQNADGAKPTSQPAASATGGMENATAAVTKATNAVVRATDGVKHVERPAEEYLRGNADKVWPHVGLYLANSGFPVPVAGAQWRDMREFARSTVRQLSKMHLFDRHGALLDVAFPLDPYFAVLPLLPTTNDWVPAIGDALGQIFEQVITTSLRRLGPRWFEHATLRPEAAGIADEAQSLVAAASLIPSAPIDLAVREGLTHGATVELQGALPMPSKVGRKAPRALRRTEIEWMGPRDKALWSCVRTDLADATPEEVAAALDRERHGLTEGGSTLDAFRLVQVGNVFALPPSWARTFPKSNAKLFAPNHDEASPNVQLAVASSAYGEQIALSQATHGDSAKPEGGHAAPKTAAVAIDQLTESQVQLAYISKALGPWHLADDALAGLAWVSRKQIELATGTPEQIAEWTPVVTHQATRLHKIAEAIKQVVGSVRGHGGDARSRTQLTHILATYARAAAISQIADASDKLIDDAAAEASLVTLAALRSSTNDLTMAFGTGSGVDAKETAAVEQTQLETRILQGKLVRGETVSAEDVEWNLLRTQELALNLKVEGLGRHLGVLDREVKGAGEGLMSILVTQFDGKFKSLDEVVGAFRGHLRWFETDWENDQDLYAAKAIRDPNESADAMKQARRARLTNAQARFAQIRNDKELVHALQTAASIIQRHQTFTRIATACAHMLAMIGIGMLAAGAGGLVTRAIGSIGAESGAIEGATMMARVARISRAVGSRLVGAEVEAGINAVGQVGLQGGSFKEAFAENALMSLGSGLILSRFGKDLEFAEHIERKTGSMWERAKVGGAVLLAKGLTITSHVIINAAVSYVAHQIVMRGHAEPTSAELSEWFLQGASVAIGRYIHSKLDSRQQLRQKLALASGLADAQRLLQNYDHVLALTEHAETAPNDAQALALLAAHRQLVQDEMTLLDSALTDPAKRRALDLSESVVHALRKQNAAQFAELQVTGMASLPLHAAGLHEVATGEAWRGTQAQIDHAIAQARAAGMTVEVTADPKTGVQRATINGESFDLLPVAEGHAKPAPVAEPAKEVKTAEPAHAKKPTSEGTSKDKPDEPEPATEQQLHEIARLRSLLRQLEDAKHPLSGDAADPKVVAALNDEITQILDDLGVTGTGGRHFEPLVAKRLSARENETITDRFRDPRHRPPAVAKDLNQDGITDSARVGVPAMEIPEQIPRLKGLPHDAAVAQERFAGLYEREGGREALARQYLESVTDEHAGNQQRTAEERKTFATDDAKDLSADYNLAGGQASKEQRNAAKARMNLAVHQTANAIAKLAFTMRLDQIAFADPGATVMVTAGGVAAGKSHAIGNNAEARAMADRAAVIWDSAGEQNSTELPWVIAEAKKRGLVIEILYVHQVPEDSWPRVVSRAKEKGRMVDARLHAESYAEGARNFDAVQRRFPEIKTVVIDVSGKVVRQIESLPKEARTVDPNAVHQRNTEELRNGKDVSEPVKSGGMEQGEGVWGAPDHRAIVSELAAIPISHLPAGSVVQGSPGALDRSTYYVSLQDGKRMLELAARLGPTVQTRAYRKGFILRHTASPAGEWYFEFNDHASGAGAAPVSAPREGGLPAPNAATVELWGFSGVREIGGRKPVDWTDQEQAEVQRVRKYSPLMFAGHIGISLDGGKTIIGFTPDVPEGMETHEAMGALMKHEAFPGVVGDDTHIFLEAAALARDRGWSTEPVVAVELVDQPKKLQVLADVARMSGMAPGEHGFGYSFPLRPHERQPGAEPFAASNGFPANCVRNCGKFPEEVGVKIPEPTGQVREYLPELQKWATEDGPKDFRQPEEATKDVP